MKQISHHYPSNKTRHVHLKLSPRSSHIWPHRNSWFISMLRGKARCIFYFTMLRYSTFNQKENKPQISIFFNSKVTAKNSFVGLSRNFAMKSGFSLSRAFLSCMNKVIYKYIQVQFWKYSYINKGLFSSFFVWCAVHLFSRSKLRCTYLQSTLSS